MSRRVLAELGRGMRMRNQPTRNGRNGEEKKGGRARDE
jgi:hypothetical protein